VEYRFCPRCGAAIKTGAAEPDLNTYTIPPALKGSLEIKPGQPPIDAESKADAGQLRHQTRAPLIEFEKYRPEIKPPAGLPPPSYFRTNTHRAESERYKKKEADKGSRVMVLLILAFGVLVLLAVGGYFILLYQ
jgi:hypothetical protein